MTLQVLILTLDGITAGDYLTWVRDPEPPALGQELCEVSVRGDPIGDTVEALLAWRGAAPPPSVAAQVAGLLLTPEVIGVRTRELARPTATPWPSVAEPLPAAAG
jgi:hypothetical protein